MEVREGVREERRAEKDPASPARPPDVVDRGREQQREEPGPDVLQMRQLIEPVGNEREEDPARDRGKEGSESRADHRVPAVPGQREPEERSEVVDGDGAGAEEARRKENPADEKHVFAERQREPGGMKNGRVPDRLAVEGRVLDPLQEPGIEVGVSRIGQRAIEVARQRPCHRDREQKKDEKDEKLTARGAREAAAIRCLCPHRNVSYVARSPRAKWFTSETESGQE